MAHSGYFPVSDLKTLRKFGSKLQGHPHREYLDILETSSGPLGAGLSQSAGMALAWNMNKAENSGRYIYCLIGDGELNEGENWEALMLIRKYNLHNIITIIDRNNIQIDGFTEDILPLEPLSKKIEAFGFNTINIDGNNIHEFLNAVESAKKVKDKPSVIIAKTVPGKGVKEFENKYEWHGKPPSKEQAVMALKELQ
jgi:transketolase